MIIKQYLHENTNFGTQIIIVKKDVLNNAKRLFNRNNKKIEVKS